MQINFRKYRAEMSQKKAVPTYAKAPVGKLVEKKKIKNAPSHIFHY